MDGQAVPPHPRGRPPRCVCVCVCVCACVCACVCMCCGAVCQEVAVPDVTLSCLRRLRTPTDLTLFLCQYRTRECHYRFHSHSVRLCLSPLLPPPPRLGPPNLSRDCRVRWSLTSCTACASVHPCLPVSLSPPSATTGPRGTTATTAAAAVAASVTRPRCPGRRVSPAAVGAVSPRPHRPVRTPRHPARPCCPSPTWGTRLRSLLKPRPS